MAEDRKGALMKDGFIDPELSGYYQEFPLVLVDVGASGGLKKKGDGLP